MRKIGKAFAWSLGELGETEMPSSEMDAELVAAWNEWLPSLSAVDRDKLPSPDDGRNQSVLLSSMTAARSARPTPIDRQGSRITPLPAGAFEWTILLYVNLLTPDDWVRLASIYLTKIDLKD